MKSWLIKLSLIPVFGQKLRGHFLYILLNLFTWLIQRCFIYIVICILFIKKIKLIVTFTLVINLIVIRWTHFLLFNNYWLVNYNLYLHAYLFYTWKFLVCAPSYHIYLRLVYIINTFKNEHSEHRKFYVSLLWEYRLITTLKLLNLADFSWFQLFLESKEKAYDHYDFTCYLLFGLMPSLFY